MTGSASSDYTYDALGNLLKVVIPGGTIVEYVVDGTSRRVAKKVNGVLVEGYLYDGSTKIVARTDGAGLVTDRYVYGSKPNVPDYILKGGATLRILSDHLGSPRLIINTADGSIVQQIAYDEFGVVVSDSRPGFTVFGFAGGLYDAPQGSSGSARGTMIRAWGGG